MWIVNTIRDSKTYQERWFLMRVINEKLVISIEGKLLLILIQVVINIGGVGYLYLYKLVTRIKNSG